ncbi:MAG: hypothetical protein FD180_368 [Planctomycetota bacterium]|nr:MAG: hypothetical protein FD180_368 [Planctomycetota bacterium]
MPWLIGAGVIALWLLWTAAPWLRRGATTNHTEVHGGAVVSIQEGPCANPPDSLAPLYFRRLARLGGYLALQTSCTESASVVRFLFIPLVRFGALRREEDRETLTIGRALLSGHGGTLSFVRKAGRVRVELRGFRPRLAMLLYRWTQLPLHAAAGRSFVAWVARSRP